MDFHWSFPFSWITIVIHTVIPITHNICRSSWLFICVARFQLPMICAVHCIPIIGEEDRCLHVALHAASFPENAYQICHHENNHWYSRWMCSAWVGQTTPFSRRGSRNAAEDDPRPNILQLNTDGLTENAIFVIEQLAYKNKAFIIVLQETHCTTADKLVIPNFSQAGSILSRNHGLTTFVHERLEWSLVDQSPK